MAQEIERKFLVCNDQWRDTVESTARYRQAYISEDGACSIRIRIAGNKANLNIKGATLGIVRTEYEYPLPLQDALEMLDNFTLGLQIEKTRHFVRNNGHIWEIDVFEGANEGLIVAEIELDDVDEKFSLPSWVGKQVSDDKRYYNVYLAHHPYSEW